MGGEFLEETESLNFHDAQKDEEFNHVQSFRYRYIKRMADSLLALIGLVPCLLISVPVAVLILCTSRGPVFYREYRIGRYGNLFQIFKFRTMYTGEARARRLEASEHSALQLRCTHKGHRDPRVTPIGRILRRWSVDELPQILNVIRGEMSFIGPRPIVAAERKFYGEDFSTYCLVKPGLSGLWQVSGRSTTGYGKRVHLDCRYVRDWSPVLDLAIFFRTIYVVVTAHGAC
jgi:lipopolysaccharide/colanic/teichoic acid biosynthesis glycosyltransferase